MNISLLVMYMSLTLDPTWVCLVASERPTEGRFPSDLCHAVTSSQPDACCYVHMCTHAKLLQPVNI